MSYLGTAIKLCLERRQMPGSRIAELAEIEPSLFSKYLNKDVRPSRDFLEKICLAFTEIEDRAEIVIAHLRDETPPSTAELIEILSLVKAGSTVREEPENRKPKLPKKALDDFDYLMRRAESHPEVIDWIGSTVDVIKGR